MKMLFLGMMVLLGIGLIGGCSVIAFRNGLVNQEETVSQQWGEVENQLQRRYDLIPNLVATVKGYAKHEETVFKNIADARAAMFAAKGIRGKADAESNLNAALSRLLAVAENYPNLKANENFIRLQDEIAGTENRKAVAVKRYNDAVKDFNASIKMFPGNLFGFTAKEYYNPPSRGKIETAPEVKFGN